MPAPPTLVWSRSCRATYDRGLGCPNRSYHWAEGGPMAGGATTPGRSVTSRPLAVLDAFSASSPRLSLSEIAGRAGLPLTTAHRLLGELTAWGALSRRTDGRYEIGRRLWDLGL